MSDQPGELARKIDALETEAVEALDGIRLLEEQWAEYRQVAQESAAVFEQAGVAMGTKNYFVQRDLSARREVDNHIARLAGEQSEVLEEFARGVRSESEAELERLRRERGGAPWA
ncbi:hypothetical protein [Leifsonia sp. NPDC077715]|uniref:hypothetical protein n=1 Tax=Leifsonia sp. NPDC077715 TaxID=3155539 RepID=UPI00341DF79D